MQKSRLMQDEKKNKTLKRFYASQVLCVGGEKVTDFGEIYAEYFSDVYKYVLTLCRNEDIAEEMTQQTFFKALQKIEQFNGSCKLYVWLCQIAKNTYFSFYQRQKMVTPVIDADYPDTSSNLEMDFLDKETTSRLHVLLHSLAEPYKEVFTLRVLGELPFSQIGALFEKTDSWARLVFYRAKIRLREAMK
jgi:RNA polymerase sigma-70 factor (ECF subfamily)